MSTQPPVHPTSTVTLRHSHDLQSRSPPHDRYNGRIAGSRLMLTFTERSQFPLLASQQPCRMAHAPMPDRRLQNPGVGARPSACTSRAPFGASTVSSHDGCDLTKARAATAAT